VVLSLLPMQAGNPSGMHNSDQITVQLLYLHDNKWLVLAMDQDCWFGLGSGLALNLWQIECPGWQETGRIYLSIVQYEYSNLS
jgi:hypothetical protein